jgi:hypothetical protein
VDNLSIVTSVKPFIVLSSEYNYTILDKHVAERRICVTIPQAKQLGRTRWLAGIYIDTNTKLLPELNHAI